MNGPYDSLGLEVMYRPSLLAGPSRAPSLAASLLMLLLAGCSISSMDEYPDIERRSLSITVDETDRARVRALLGSPWLASSSWGFDVFRERGTSVVLTGFLVPVAVSTDELTGYVLVSYDDYGVVTGLDHGLTRTGSMESTPYPEDAILRAAEIRLLASGKRGDASVAVSPSLRDLVLVTDEGVSGCWVLVGCGGICSMQVAFDHGAPVRIPDVYYAADRPLLPVNLPTGKHTLRVAPDEPYRYPFKQISQAFSCVAAETVYLELESTASENNAAALMLRIPLQVRATLSREQPGAFAERPLVIYASGLVLGQFEAVPP